MHENEMCYPLNKDIKEKNKINKMTNKGCFDENWVCNQPFILTKNQMIAQNELQKPQDLNQRSL